VRIRTRAARSSDECVVGAGDELIRHETHAPAARLLVADEDRKI